MFKVTADGFHELNRANAALVLSREVKDFGGSKLGSPGGTQRHVSPQFVNMHRVFKASVLDRNGVDRNDENASYKGRITLPNLKADDVKLIVEYLWMFTLSNNYRNAVLASYTTETENEFVHTMKQARLNLNYSGGCDDIEVYEVYYRIPKDSGFIWKEKVLTDTFSAKRTDSYLEICL